MLIYTIFNLSFSGYDMTYSSRSFSSRSLQEAGLTSIRAVVESPRVIAEVKDYFPGKLYSSPELRP
jgi:hypothetical protein